MNPTVTAIIPVHNHEKWVRDAVNSIVTQTYKNLRLVIVDDGSTDNSFQACLEMMPKAFRPKQLQEEPEKLCMGKIKEITTILAGFKQARGPSFARNYGIKTGWQDTDLFAFLDSDDWYEPTKIEESVKVWMEHPQMIAIIYSDYTTVNIESGYRQRQFKEPYSRKRLLEECIINCDSLFSKWALEKAGLFDESLRTCEDYDRYCALSEIGTCIHIPHSLVNIRVGKHSSTDTVSKENWEKNYRRVFEKLYERMKGKN